METDSHDGLKEKRAINTSGGKKRKRSLIKAFAAAIFFPVAPDDLLCYLAGLTEMRLGKFVLIILLGKPLSIFYTALDSTGIMQRDIDALRLITAQCARYSLGMLSSSFLRK